MGATDLQIPDALADPAETAVGLGGEVGCQVTRFAERQMHAFVEVLAGLAVAPDDLVGNEIVQERPEVVPERFIVFRQLDAGEVHPR